MIKNSVDVIFLGLNDAGKRIYDWLCDREDANVLAMLTTLDQLELVHELKPELIVSVGYGHRVPEDVLSVPELGAVNMHPAYLPWNRGKDPAIWAIVDDTPAGVTLHYMDESLDTGDIIERQEIEKYPDDTGKTLHDRLEDAEFDVFTDHWNEIASCKPDTLSQSGTKGTFNYGREFDELCELDRDEHVRAGDFLRRLRALTFPPYDNAYFTVDGTKYFVEIDIYTDDE